MIRRLRVKFVCVNMLIVTVMLCVILGLVTHFMSQTIRMQSVNMMQRIAAAPLHFGIAEEADDQSEFPFFIVQIGHRGEILSAYGGFDDLSDSAYLQQIVSTVCAKPAQSGVLEDDHLRWCKTMAAGGQRIVFSDTAGEEAALRNLRFSCIGIGIISFAAFLVISICLSRWAIKPVAAAWDQQRQFVADASHELKTPLSVIMANAELLRSGESSADEQSRFSENILSTSYQMRSLVENMLDMARVDNGTVKLNMADVDFSQLVSDAVLSFQLLYEEKGMELHPAIQEGIALRGNEQYLYQVLDVLLDNGLKYSAPNGCVSVVLNRSGKNCVLCVSTPGEPLSETDQKQIFKRFYRGDKARSMNGSYGLGLSIAESVVTAHKGKIWAESSDGFNRFYVQLPVVRH